MSHHRTSRLIGLDFPLLLFLLSAVFGLWPAYDPSLCQDTLVVLVAGVLLYVLLSRLAVFHHRWRAAAAFITFTCALLSLYFVTQYDHIGYPEKVGAVSRLGVLIGRVVPPLVFWTPTANSMAAFLEGGLFLAVALVLTEERWTGRIVGAIGVGLIALALLMSASRGAWLAVAVTALLWLALYWRPARVLAAVGALAALGLIVYVVARGDITVLGDIPIIDRTLAPMFIRPDRLEVYRNSVYLIQDFPLTGIGLGGQFAMVLSKYALLIQVPFLTYSHNLYLEVWLQQGLPGITALLWLIAALYQAARTHAKPGPDLIYQSTWLGLSAIFVHGISDALQYASLWCWFPFFGLLGLNGAILLRRAPARPRGREWILPAGVAVGFLSIVAISLLPLQATWHANLGSVLQARGDLPESLADEQRADLRRQAVDNYQRALEIAPGNRTAHQRWGVILTEEERFQDAVEHLEAAQRADPNNTTTHKALGLAYVWVGELEKAQLLLQNAPDIVAELNTWGWWRGSRQQIELSLNAYRTSLLLEPNQPNVQERVEQLESE
jgi:O-antigen ligase